MYIQCIYIYIYIIHSHIHTLWFINLAWYLKLPFTLEASWDSVRIIFQKGWTRERGEKGISSYLLPLQVSITPSSHIFPIFLLMNLIIWSQCTSANNVFEWSEFQNQKSKRIFPREENCVKWCCGNLVPCQHLHTNFVLPWVRQEWGNLIIPEILLLIPRNTSWLFWLGQKILNFLSNGSYRESRTREKCCLYIWKHFDNHIQFSLYINCNLICI